MTHFYSARILINNLSSHHHDKNVHNLISWPCRFYLSGINWIFHQICFPRYVHSKFTPYMKFTTWWLEQGVQRNHDVIILFGQKFFCLGLFQGFCIYPKRDMFLSGIWTYMLESIWFYLPCICSNCLHIMYYLYTK